MKIVKYANIPHINVKKNILKKLCDNDKKRNDYVSICN